MKNYTVFILLFFSSFLLNAQVSQYWVIFKEKPEKEPIQVSAFAAKIHADKGVAPNETSMKVSPKYIEKTLAQIPDAKILGISNWFNAIRISFNGEIPRSVKKLNFVKEVRFLGSVSSIKSVNSWDNSSLDEKITALDKKLNQDSIRRYEAFSNEQLRLIGASKLHHERYTGKGIRIGVCDAGFLSVNKSPFFAKVRDENRIIASRNFDQPGQSVYQSDRHGTAVLSCMASNIPGLFVGTAPDAQYVLMITENNDVELPIEEVQLAEALEFADSCGVDLINLSIGYAAFDSPFNLYRKKDLNGKNSISAQAVNIAQRNGVLIVCSAGNEGNDEWRMLSVPADADSIITVGSSNLSGDISKFSSYGPSSDKRIKPEIIAPGEDIFVADGEAGLHRDNGTSFSSPLICGWIACLMQKYPNVHPQMIRNAIVLSSELYLSPGNQSGYGRLNPSLCEKLLINYASDSLIDIRWNLQQIEIIINLTSAQKIKYEIYNTESKLVSKGKFKVKSPGLFRAALASKNKKETYLFVRLILNNQSVEAIIPSNDSNE